MISQAARDWTVNPVVTSTDNVEAPIKELPFPSLSVCHKDPNYHKNWQVPELIFNFIDVKKSDTKVQEMLVGFSNFTKNDIDTISVNFGTSLRMLAKYANLGVISPPKIPEKSCTFDSAKDAQTFHDILKLVGLSFNSKVSLYDIPKLFNPLMPPKPSNQLITKTTHNLDNLPSYSLCEIDPTHHITLKSEELCRSVWVNLTSSLGKENSNLNPYLTDNENVAACGPGLEQNIG